MSQLKTSGYTYTVTPQQEISEVSSEDNGSRPKIELGDHTPMTKPRGWTATFFWQTLALLWLVPIVATLYLNFTQYIIGASAWCPGGHCWLNAFNYDTFVPAYRASVFDHESHNLLGGLQFAAKGVEIWFGVIAAALMYMITMKMAGQKEGLPVGYLTRPMEFADPITLVDGLLWKTGPSPFGMKSATEKRLGRRVWTLVAISIFLCILINLMGPATAVLVIPALSWIDTAKVGDKQFLQMATDVPPSTTADRGLWWTLQHEYHHHVCDETEFLAHNYTCIANSEVGLSMDTWLSSMMASRGGLNGFSSQQGLSFAANLTRQFVNKNSLNLLRDQVDQKSIGHGQLWWAPSRQVLNRLFVDRSIIADLSVGLPVSYVATGAKELNWFADPIKTYAEYNKSLELAVERNGPIAAALPTMFVDYNSTLSKVINVDSNRQIRCYNWYNIAQMPFEYDAAEGNYTKCIRTGTGWNKQNKQAEFYTEKVFNTYTYTTDPGVNIYVYSSDKAAFFPNGTFPSWLPKACLNDGPRLNSTICPWERMFTTDPTSPVYNRTENITTVEFYMSNGRGKGNTSLIVDFTVFPGFTSYTLDTSPTSNPLSFVATGDLQPQPNSIYVDPSWYLAAWGTADKGTLLSNRTSTTLLQSVMQWQYQNGWSGEMGLWGDYDNQAYICLLPILQTLSLLDHATATATDLKAARHDPAHPLLQRWARMYVWCYGLGSRTSYLGVTVAILGCIVVLVQVGMGLMDRRRYRSPTQLLVAALEHSPRGEFEGKQHDELAMARVRFHIKDHDALAGKFSFYEPEEKGDALIS